MLSGKTVFVSGGTGYIGEAICRTCIDYGAEVIFSYHENETVAQRMVSTSDRMRAVQINLRDPSDIKTKVESLYAEVQKIDILINNAGVSLVMPLSLLEDEDLDYLLDVNVKGTVHLTKAIVRGMIRRKSGAIINIGSIAGQRILDVPVHYALSKAAISGFTFSLAAELKRYGIRVNAIVPGMIEGGISKGIPDDLKADFVKHCLVGRPGTGREVAEVVCFVASDRASYVNGQNICVDGGI